MLETLIVVAIIAILGGSTLIQLLILYVNVARNEILRNKLRFLLEHDIRLGFGTKDIFWSLGHYRRIKKAPSRVNQNSPLRGFPLFLHFTSSIVQNQEVGQSKKSPIAKWAIS